MAVAKFLSIETTEKVLQFGGLQKERQFLEEVHKFHFRNFRKK